MTFKDLQDGADTLSRYFRDKGYIAAHAYLPVQNRQWHQYEALREVGKSHASDAEGQPYWLHDGIWHSYP